MAKNKIVIKIAGTEYTLVGNESEEYIQKVALHIDKKIEEIIKQNNKLSTSMASILAAINVTDDYFKSSEREKNATEILKKMKDEIEILNLKIKHLCGEIEILTIKNNALSESKNISGKALSRVSYISTENKILKNT